LETTGTFRSWRDVDELWDVVVSHLTSGVNSALEFENDPEIFLHVKEDISTFVMALEVSLILVERRLILIITGISIFDGFGAELHFISV